MINPLEDRRQSAREAYWDDMRGLSMRTSGIEAAIETATRVRITPAIRDAMITTMTVSLGDWEASLAAAFRAAGFEVVE